MRLLLAGGGTGGHIYPALTVAEALRERVKDLDILFVGSKRGLEGDVIPKAGYRLATIDVMGFKRSISAQNLTVALKAGKSLLDSWRIIRSFRPDVVVGTGGYVSGPVILAASLMGLPTMIQEQNVVPGVTNRVLARFVRAVAVSHEESRRYFGGRARVVVTGNPIRPAILAATRDQGVKELGLDPGLKTLLIFGGSQGSLAINRAVVEALPGILEIPCLQVLHQTGSKGYEEARRQVEDLGLDEDRKRRLELLPYIYHMEYALAAADLVIGRAGAISIAEITAKGIPAILIPLPTAAEHHQERNARALEDAGACVVIPEPLLSGERLLSTVRELFSDPGRLSAMAAASRRRGRPEATQEITGLILALARGEG